MTDLLMQWHSAFLDPGRIPYILGALLVCAVIGLISGPLLGNANPLLWRLADFLFGSVGERLDRKKRKNADLIFRGFLVTAFALALFVLLGKLAALVPLFYPSAADAAEILLLALALTAGSVWFTLLKLYFAMEKGGIGKGAYYAIATTARRNLSAADDFAITRAAMALCVRTFDKGLVAPALWYLIGGFPFLFVYSALAALGWRFGKSGFHSGFAAAPLALERLMGFIPSLLSAVFITLAALFTPTAKTGKALSAWLGAKNRSPYEQGGLPLSALAWALNVSLGGASQDISGSAIKGEWVGPEGATAKLDHKHLRRALYISVIAHILFMAALIGLYIWSGVLT